MSYCTATNRQGNPCRAQARNGAAVCRNHGGNAPQVQRAAQARLEASADRVLEELCHISLVDIRDAFDTRGNLIDVKKLPERVAKAISGIEYEDNYETGKNGIKVRVGRTAKIKLIDKLGGLDKLARHLGMYAAESTPGGVQSIQLLVMQAGAPQVEGGVDIMSLVKT